MPFDLADFAYGAIFAGAIALAARRAHALSGSGALAAFVVGTITYGAGTWTLTLVLLAFFIPSVVLSRVGRERKKSLVDIGKGGARDAWQVLANGGIATLCALGYFIMYRIEHAGLGCTLPACRFVLLSGSRDWFLAFAGAYAAATADTWGTEIGTLARGVPRSILTFRPIAAGLSGGVTLMGSLAEVAGAAWIALVAAIFFALAAFTDTRERAIIELIVVAAGIFGAVVDSMLGGSLQELRRCPQCERTCETDPHVCGTPTVLVRGIRGFSNDLVNALATLAGAGAAFGLGLLLRG